MAVKVVAALGQSCGKGFIEQEEDYGKNRDADQHTDDAHDVAADYYRDQHPDRAQAGGIAEQERLDDVSVKELQDAGEDNEPKRIPRIYQQQDERAGDGADERAEVRDQVGYCDYRRDEQRIGHTHYQHEDVVGDKDDERVQQAAADIDEEDAVALAHDIAEAPERLFGEQSGGDTARKALEVLLVQQDVDREDGRDDEVEHAAAELVRAADDAADILDHPVGNAHEYLFPGADEPVDIEHFGIDERNACGQGVECLLQRVEIALEVVEQHYEGGGDLRDDCYAQDRYGGQRREQRQKHAERVRDRLLFHLSEDGAFKKFRYWIQQICDCGAPDEGVERGEHARKEAAYGIELLQEHIIGYGSRRDAEQRGIFLGLEFFKQLFKHIHRPGKCYKSFRLQML